MKRTAFLFLLILACAAVAQTLTPPEKMTVKGVPPIPQSLVDEVGKYTEFRTAGFVDWHPKERSMLIATRFGEVAQIHSVAFPGGARRQITFFKEPVGNASYEPVNGNYILYSRDIGGSENYQIYRMDMATYESTLLTDGKSQNGGDMFSNKGDRIVYNSTKRNGNDRDFYIMDPLDPKSEKLLCENKGGGWGMVDWSPDDKQILVGEYISINESYLYLLDVASGKMTILTPKDEKEKVAYSAAKFDKTGKGIYIVSDKESEFARLAHMDLATKKISYITTDIKWDISSFVMSHNRELAALEINEEGASVLKIMDLNTKKYLPAPALPVGIIGGLAWHKNNKELALSMGSARSQFDVYSIDVPKKQLTRWTFSETAGVNTENFSEAKLIKWKSFDGLEISGFLYMPPARFTGKRPVIIDVHGGPEGQAQPGFLGRNNYLLNELGVAVIYPNVRGSSGFGKTFLQLDNGMKRDHSYKDVDALIDWIHKQSYLNGDKIMVTGGSYGGNVTLAMSAFYSDKIACALSVVGASNLVTFLENTAGYRRDLRRVEYGNETDPEMRKYLLSIAPLNYIEQIKKPLFIVQGLNDPRVPASESEQIVAKMESKGIPVWYMLAKDEGHGFQKKVNRDYQFYATVMFIKQFLLN